MALFDSFFVVSLSRGGQPVAGAAVPASSPASSESRAKDCLAAADFCFADDPWIAAHRIHALNASGGSSRIESEIASSINNNATVVAPGAIGGSGNGSLSDRISLAEGELGHSNSSDRSTGGSTVAGSVVSESPFAFVLTDSDGRKRFGFVRRKIDAAAGVAKAFCIISDKPWFSLFAAVLGAVASNEKATMMSVVEQHLVNVLKVPLPLQLPATFATFFGSVHVDSRVGMGWSEFGDVPFDSLVRSLCPKNVARVMGAASLERRIIMSSSSLTRVSHACLALAAALFPFRWQHILIPVLPNALLHYCCAPMPFIVGVPTSCLAALQTLPLEAVVFVDLDDDTVVAGGTDEGNADASVAGTVDVQHSDPIDDVPPAATAALKNNLKAATNFLKRNQSSKRTNGSGSRNGTLRSHASFTEEDLQGSGDIVGELPEKSPAPPNFREAAEHALFGFWIECGFSKWVENAPTTTYDSAEPAMLSQFESSLSGIKGASKWFALFRETQLFDVFVNEWQERNIGARTSRLALDTSRTTDALQYQPFANDPVGGFALLLSRPDLFVAPYARSQDEKSSSLRNAFNTLTRKSSRSNKLASLRGKKDKKKGDTFSGLPGASDELNVVDRTLRGNNGEQATHTTLRPFEAEDIIFRRVGLEDSGETAPDIPSLSQSQSLSTPPYNEQAEPASHQHSHQPMMTLNEILAQKSKLSGASSKSSASDREADRRAMLKRLSNSGFGNTEPNFTAEEASRLTPPSRRYSVHPASSVAIDDQIMSASTRTELQRRLSRGLGDRSHTNSPVRIAPKAPSRALAPPVRRQPIDRAPTRLAADDLSTMDRAQMQNFSKMDRARVRKQFATSSGPSSPESLRLEFSSGQRPSPGSGMAQSVPIAIAGRGGPVMADRLPAELPTARSAPSHIFDATSPAPRARRPSFGSQTPPPVTPRRSFSGNSSPVDSSPPPVRPRIQGSTNAPPAVGVARRGPVPPRSLGHPSRGPSPPAVRAAHAAAFDSSPTRSSAPGTSRMPVTGMPGPPVVPRSAGVGPSRSLTGAQQTLRPALNPSRSVSPGSIGRPPLARPRGTVVRPPLRPSRS